MAEPAPSVVVEAVDEDVLHADERVGRGKLESKAVGRVRRTTTDDARYALTCLLGCCAPDKRCPSSSSEHEPGAVDLDKVFDIITSPQLDEVNVNEGGYPKRPCDFVFRLGLSEAAALQGLKASRRPSPGMLAAEKLIARSRMACSAIGQSLPAFNPFVAHSLTRFVVSLSQPVRNAKELMSRW